MFDGFRAFLGALGHPGWPAIYVRLELGLLQELGFGLDLKKCAATGTREDLAYVSPRTGRAVSRVAAGPYKEKLLTLPGFLSTGGLPSDDEQLRLGFDLTGYFLERHVFWPHNKPLFYRTSAVDEVGWTIEDSINLAKVLKAKGVDVFDCSSGGMGNSA